MMRMLAWCGTTSAISSAVTPAWRIDFWAESTMIRTARRKTSLPSILIGPPTSDCRIDRADAVGVEVPTEQLAGALDDFEDDRARAVGEQDGGAAVVPVGDARQACRCRSRAHGRRPCAISPWPVISAYTKPVHAAFTSNAPHRRPSSFCTDGGVARTGGRGGGGEDDRVDAGRVEPGHLQRLPARLDRQADGGAADAAFVDAGARDDPLVARVHRGGELVVGEDLLGQRGAPTRRSPPLWPLGVLLACRPPRTTRLRSRGAQPGDGLSGGDALGVDGDVALQRAAERRADLVLADVAEHRARPR